jgi:hypothetical protein
MIDLPEASVCPNPKLTVLRELFLPHTLLMLRGDSILEIVCANNVSYDATQVQEIITEQKEISQGQSYPVLVLAGEYTLVSADARELMATQAATEFSLAEAYVIKSTAQRLLINFYLKINKPKVPTCFFYDQSGAEKWLREITAKK